MNPNMRTCICCGTRADADAVTCANCGEASWSIAKFDPLPTSIESHDAKSEVPTTMQLASVWDPDTAIEVPLKRRNKRPN